MSARLITDKRQDVDQEATDNYLKRKKIEIILIWRVDLELSKFKQLTLNGQVITPIKVLLNTLTDMPYCLLNAKDC